MRYASTLAVVIGITTCPLAWAVGTADRFIPHATLAIGLDEPGTPSGSELLRKGIKEFQWGQYDDAHRAFEEAAKLPGLDEREQELLGQYRALMVRVRKSRQDAASALQAAQKAVEQGDHRQAEALATKVLASGYAATEDRDAARAIMDKVQSGAAAPVSPAAAHGPDQRSEAYQLLAVARQHLRQGHLDEAEATARQAESLNLSYPAYEDSPAKVMRDVADARHKRTTPQAPPPRTPAEAKARAKTLLSQAQASLKRNDVERAEQLARQAKSLGARFAFYETSPDDVLSDIEKTRRKLIASGKAPRQPAKPASDLRPASHESMPSEHSGVVHADESANSDAAGANDAQARQLVAQARRLIDTGHFDEAEQLLAQAESSGVDWSRHGNPIPSLRRELARARGAASGNPANAGYAQAAGSASGDDARQEALELLRAGRQHLSEGRLDQAEKLAQTARDKKATYRLLDDTPNQLSADIARARGQTNVLHAEVHETSAPAIAEEVAAIPTTRPSGSAKDLNRLAAKWLKRAREYLAQGDYESALEIARRIDGWKLEYGLWADTPARVASAGRALRSQAVARKSREPARPADRPGMLAENSHSRQSPATSSQSSGIALAEHTALGVRQASHEPYAPTGSGSGEPPAQVVELLADVKSLPLSPQNARRGSGPIVQAGAESLAPSGGPSLSGPAERDQHKLELAEQLFEQGNYARAREMAQEIESSNPALRTQAQELIARVGVMEHATAVELYHAGVAAVSKKEYSRALGFFRQVAASQVQLDQATEQQLQNYLHELPARIGEEGDSPRAGVARVSDGRVQTPSDLASSPGQRERIKLQQLVAETNERIQAAKRVLPTDPAQAIKDLEQAREHVQVSGLDDTMTAPLVRRLDVAIRAASQEKERIDIENLEDKAREAVHAQRERELTVQHQKQQEMTQLVDRCNALMREGQFAQAEAVARRATEIDPDSPAAVALLWKARIEHRNQINRELREQKENRILDTFDGVEDSAIPFGNDNKITTRYPDAKVWEDLTKRRLELQNSLETGGKSPRTLELERKLEQPISVDFKETPLADVVDFFRDFTGTNVVLDAQALATDGITSDRPVTMRLDNVKLKSALRLILPQLDLDYMIRDEALVITTPIQKQGKLFTKTYSVSDLVIPISPFAGATHFTMPGATSATVGNPGTVALPSVGLAQFGTGLGGTPPLGIGSQGSGSPGFTGLPNQGQPGAGQMVDFDSLIELIQNVIRPSTWSDVGGSGTIEEFEPNLSLVISQTQAVHDEIADLLQQLRRLQDLQVTVEVRFITLTEDFFERIGIDFDVLVQSNQQQPLRHFGQEVTGETGGGVLGESPTPPVLNLNYFDHEDDFAVGIGGPFDQTAFRGNFTPDLKIPFRTGGFGKGRPSSFVPGDGLSFGIAFLSDIEVYLFLEAAQQNNRGNVLSAPKVTLFNGQLAFTFSGTLEPFVTELTPVIAAGAIAFDPQIETIFNGPFLIVQAVVSADRRYVRLFLAPFFNQITGERRFAIAGGAGGGGVIGGGGGGAAVVQSELVVPIIATNFIITTVSVPDGGTVLLGGLKTKSEIRNEFGTPILNKLPYVNRLFMNTGVSSITRSLMLMVTPRIIIQEEEEELLGKTIAF